MKPTLNDHDIDDIASLVCSARHSAATWDAVREGVRNMPWVGLADRLAHTANGWRYYAGQDYPAEIARLRRYFARSDLQNVDKSRKGAGT